MAAVARALARLYGGDVGGVGRGFMAEWGAKNRPLNVQRAERYRFFGSLTGLSDQAAGTTLSKVGMPLS